LKISQLIYFWLGQSVHHW